MIRERIPKPLLRAPQPREQVRAKESSQPILQAKAPDLKLNCLDLPMRAPAASMENKTGLPDNLKAGIEAMSGLSMDAVKVHYGSSEPGRVGALAFAQGTNIHLGPGQEKHLAHEAWHVVQQAQGRVKPTMQLKSGAAVNDDAGLEREADDMGRLALASTAPRNQGRLSVSQLMVGRTIQRYTLPVPENKDNRHSDNGAIAVTGPKAVYATQQKIDEANSALAGVAGGAGAYLRLAASGTTHAGNANLLGVKPVWNAPRAAAARTPAHQKELGDKNTDPNAYLSHADCHLTAQTIMGSSSNLAGLDDTEKPVVGGQVIEPIKTEVELRDRNKAGGHIANRGLDAFYLHAMPGFVEVLKKQPHGEELHKVLIEKILAIPKNATGIQRYINLYKSDIETDAALLALFSKEFKINEFAAPEIGDALVQVNDEVEKKTRDEYLDKRAKGIEAVEAHETAKDELSAIEGKPNPFKGKGRAGKQRAALSAAKEKVSETEPSEATIANSELEEKPELWNFHWAGVVMKDGSDYVTLENLSVEFASVKNDAWYFKMYGTEAQSFHAENKGDSHVGEHSVTVPFRTTGVAQGGQAAVKSSGMQERMRLLAAQKGGTA